MFVWGDEEFNVVVKECWGMICLDWNFDWEWVIEEMWELFVIDEGDFYKGVVIFNKVCG